MSSVAYRRETGPESSNARLSVCMATYNGEQYVAEQIESILPQLDSTDELVIVDDASTDNTRAIARSFDDPRIRIVESPANNGPIGSFERAITLATGDIIILSDQDDSWPDGRVSRMREALSGTSVLVAGDLEVFRDGRSARFIRLPSGKPRSWCNIIGILLGRCPYYGSALGFKIEMKSMVLPFPRWIEAHDHWIAIVANIAGQCKHLHEVVTFRREHERNLTRPQPRSMIHVVKTRFIMMAQIVVAIGRLPRRAPFSHAASAIIPGESAKSDRRVEFVNYFFAHYRAPVMRECERRSPFTITWIGGSRQVDGIPHADMSHFASVVRAETMSVTPRLRWQHSIVLRAALANTDCVVYTGDPVFISTWIAALTSRIRGVRVLMWTHGWTHRDSGLRRLVRIAFYNLADALLIYADEGRRIGREMGYRKPIHVIHNSMSLSSYRRPRTQTTTTGRPQRWCVVSRLIENRRIEQVIDAVAYLKGTDREVALTIVGDGPQREFLEHFASDRQLGSVRFVGASYVAADVDALLQASDILVSPGNVGLAAIHALSNGCPVSTHDDFDNQNPEHVAITAQTGVRFTRGDVRSLAERTWTFVESVNPSESFEACRAEFARCWTAEAHAKELIKAVEEELEMLGARKSHAGLRSAVVRQVGPVKRAFNRRLSPAAFKEYYLQDCLPGRTGTYLEIGVRAGDSLRSVKALKRIGIDPLRDKRMRRLKDGDQFYAMTSDQFFAQQGDLLQNLRIDVALIDGLHAFRQVVRDVVNTARYLKRGGFIVLDDCNPRSAQAASPEQCPGDWNGDVWRAMAYFVQRVGKRDAITVDADHGVGILRWSPRLAEEPLDDEMRKFEELDYTDLDMNRAELLHLRRPAEWLGWRLMR